MIRAAALATEARAWVGVPYVHQGRTRFGVDCIGLIICVRQALGPWLGVELEPRNYRRVPTDGLLEQRIAEHCTQLERPEDGCVILIRWPRTAHASHAAFYFGGHIIHAYKQLRAVIETGYRAQWVRDTVSLWRLPGVA